MRTVPEDIYTEVCFNIALTHSYWFVDVICFVCRFAQAILDRRKPAYALSNIFRFVMHPKKNIQEPVYDFYWTSGGAYIPELRLPGIKSLPMVQSQNLSRI